MSPGALRNFDSVVRELADRGHSVRLVFHEERHVPGTHELLEALLRDRPTVTATTAPPLRRDPWLLLAADVRSSLDYLQFLDPVFHPLYRIRAEKRVPR